MDKGFVQTHTACISFGFVLCFFILFVYLSVVFFVFCFFINDTLIIFYQRRTYGFKKKRTKKSISLARIDPIRVAHKTRDYQPMLQTDWEYTKTLL